MGNRWAYTNTSTKTCQVGRDGNYNNQSTSAVTRYEKRKKAHGERWFSSKALRCCHEYGPEAQPKGCAWILMLPWHKQPLAHLKGLFMENECIVCMYSHMQETKDIETNEF